MGHRARSSSSRRRSTVPDHRRRRPAASQSTQDERPGDDQPHAEHGEGDVDRARSAPIVSLEARSAATPKGVPSCGTVQVAAPPNAWCRWSAGRTGGVGGERQAERHQPGASWRRGARRRTVSQPTAARNSGRRRAVTPPSCPSVPLSVTCVSRSVTATSTPRSGPRGPFAASVVAWPVGGEGSFEGPPPTPRRRGSGPLHLPAGGAGRRRAQVGGQGRAARESRRLVRGGVDRTVAAPARLDIRERRRPPGSRPGGDDGERAEPGSDGQGRDHGDAMAGTRNVHGGRPRDERPAMNQGRVFD